MLLTFLFLCQDLSQNVIKALVTFVSLGRRALLLNHLHVGSFADGFLHLEFPEHELVQLVSDCVLVEFTSGHVDMPMLRRANEDHRRLIKLPNVIEFEKLRMTRGIDPTPVNWVELTLAVIIHPLEVLDVLFVFSNTFFSLQVPW